MPFRTAEGWWSTFETRGAVWAHSGNPRQPHAVLSERMHADRVCNCGVIIAEEALLHQASSDVFEKFLACGGNAINVQGVVGPQTGATKLSKSISERVSVYTGANCFWASPAKSKKGRRRVMIFSDEERALLANQSIALCEDALTTGRTVRRTADAVIGAGGIVLPFVLVLLNRSGLTEVNGRKIIALINRPMPTWTRKECPLCKQRSKAIRPKDNWELLNAA